MLLLLYRPDKAESVMIFNILFHSSPYNYALLFSLILGLEKQMAAGAI